MPIRIVCPSCKGTYEIGDAMRGKQMRCRQCLSPFQVPANAPLVAAQPPAPPRQPALIKPVTPPRSVASNVPAKAPAPGAPPQSAAAITAPRPPAPPAPAAIQPVRNTAQSVRSVAAGTTPIKSLSRFTAPLVANKKLLLSRPVLIGGAALGVLVVFGLAVLASGLFRGAPAQEEPVAANKMPQDSAATLPKQEPDRKEADKSNAEKKDSSSTPPPKQEPPKLEPPKQEPPKPAATPAVPASAQLDLNVLKKVKKATVYMRVTLANGEVSEGSGFFGYQPGIVFTNAHVLGMLKSSKKPHRIEAVYQSGETDERVFPATVLGVDPGTDLAVLKVEGTGLPEPLEIKSAKELFETQTVYIFGFPFGEELGKNITVTTSAVARLEKNMGMPVAVQVNGGMHPGNSGGPLTNAHGEVVGVAVAIIKGTTINFAISADVVHLTLKGRVFGIAVRPPEKVGGQLKVAMKMGIVDPFKKIKQATLEYWTGEDGDTRPPADKAPAPKPGDSARQSVQFDTAFEGEVMLPELRGTQVYWVQPVLTDHAGNQFWDTAHAYKPKKDDPKTDAVNPPPTNPPPNIFPTSPYPPNYYPPGTPTMPFPPGFYPPGTQPPGTFPPGTQPPGTFPPGTKPGFPPGSFPPGTKPVAPMPGHFPLSLGSVLSVRRC